MIHGSMTPDEILFDLSLAMGLQLEALWYREKGFEIEPASIAKPKQRDRLRS